ncbi:MAG: OmpA family protein [Hyphomicrobium sp.]
MTAPLNLNRAAGLFAALLLGAAPAFPSAARDGALIVAQNPPDQPAPGQGQGEPNPKEHKKDHSDRGQQPPAPQGAAPAPAPNPSNAQQPGPGPGPQGGEPHERHRAQQPVEQPRIQQPVQQPARPQIMPQQQPVQQPKIQPPDYQAPQQQQQQSPTQQVIPQQPPAQQVIPQQQRTEPARRHRPREDRGTPAVAPNTPPAVITPPVDAVAPKVLAPLAPQNSAAPTPAPNNAQIPDTGFKRRSRADQGQRPPGQAPAQAALPTAPPLQGAQPSLAPKFTPGFAPGGPTAQRLQDLQKNRTQRTEAGGKRTIIEEPDNRVIVRQDNRVFVRHDETTRLATRAENVRSQRRPDGTTETIIARPGGVQVFNVVDGGGRLVRRYRRDGRGREINIIDNRRFYQGAAAGIAIAAGIGIAADVLGLHLGPPRIGIPRDRYIVDYDRASDDDIYEALTAPPIDRLDRAYSLEEIRYNVDLRDRMRRIDLDSINFEFGAWDVSPAYYNVLARIAAGINRAVDRNPGEVFLIEGYTDAVGSDIDNLSLSDRRAQSVAEILTEDFDVPPENLVTQGYGEEYLKIPTPGPERANRRVAVRRITPLMAQDDYR